MTSNNHTPHTGNKPLDSMQLNIPLRELDEAIDATAILTTKGDLLTYSTVNARLGIGTNGHTLSADSTATTGQGWQPDASYFAIFRDEKTSGTDGGGTTATTYVQRDLNTEVSDTRGIVSLGSDLFTPQIAGTYLIEVSAPAYDCANHKLQLYNASTLSVVTYGQVSATSTGNNSQNSATLIATFTANGSHAYSIKHWAASTKATTGFGNAVGDGAVEVYCEVYLQLISI